jgi:hypothetical protein
MRAGRTHAALVVLAFLVAAPRAGAATADGRAAERAATFLARTSAGAPAGQQADVIVALRAAGRGRAVLAPRLTRLGRDAPAYARTAGSAAKVVMAAVAAGGDPRRLAGVDYVRRVTSRYASGRYGATAFDQALSMLAVTAAGDRVPASAIRATLAARGSGGWSFDLSRSGRDTVDATAIVLEALGTAGVRRADPGVRGAVSWMLAQRNREGGLNYAGGGRITEANSTAGAIRALRALGRTPPPATRAALRGLQDRDGGIRFTRSAAGSRLLATSDALIALGGGLSRS